jgi:Nif-specific regulatory protein
MVDPILNEKSETSDLLSSLEQDMAEVQSLLEHVGGEEAALGEGPPAVLNRLRRSRLATLYDIAQQLNSIHSLRELLPRVLDLIIETMKVERGLILVRNEQTGRLEATVSHNMESETLTDAANISQSIIDDVLGGGKPVITSNAQLDPRLRDRRSVTSYGIKSILCVPMRLRDKILGTVYIDDRTAPGHFSEEDVAFLVCFANLAALSYENARLIESTRGEVLHLQREVKQKYAFENIIGNSPGMHAVFRKLESVIASDVYVLLEGESGTGKELVAHAIHHHSPRRGRLFVPINCGALPDTLIESELFGHRRGSFTGAIVDKKGLFEIADHGTIFLDEISNTSLLFQAKLLRVLHEGELRRVGDSVERRVDVRIIAATNRNLREAVAEGSFREDLYYRLNVISIYLPPLRERREDIPLLADHFLKLYAKKIGGRECKLAPVTLEAMLEYDWPGNVRELENVVQKGMVLAGGAEIRPEHLELPRRRVLAAARAGGTLQEARSRFEAEYIRQVLDECDGNVSKSAKRLGISRPQLHRLLQKHNLSSGDYRR